ncbi:fimbrial protein, partial [Escherichia coli]|uniref:fimbrial protein n=3 Tax=Escherichia coli TaxID=562 RepID=UPI00398B3065
MKRLHKRFLLATFCALFTATLQAADVTITVNGRVVAKPCTIQTKEANVNLGDLYTRNLQWICPYISRHLLSLNPLLACCRRYSRG